jgi:hypothetical protein
MVLSQTARRAHENIKRWRARPVDFVREQFKAEPDPWQAKALRKFPDNEQLAMKACKGPGKTCALSWMIWNFLATRPHPKVAATSISGDNLSDCLWTELAMWQQKSPFLSEAFHWMKTRIEAVDHPETWWASARTWSRSADKEQQADTMAGLHGDYILFVLDEVGSIPDGVMVTAEAGLATGIETKIVMAGNPTQVSGPLYRACTDEADRWVVIEITGDPDDPDRSPRIKKDWARNQIRKYGADDPWVLVNVFGKFPPSGINALLGPEEVSAAIGRHLREDQYSFAARIISIDAARFGDDRTVINKRQGLACHPPVIMRGATTDEIAARAAHEANEFPPDAIMVDGTGGWGAGVIDALRLAGFKVIEVNASGRPVDERYFNKRAECWFKMADWVKKGGALPQGCDEYRRELVAPTYTFVNNRFRLEAKEQIKDRLGESPDVADALSLSFAQDVMPKFEAASPMDKAMNRGRKRAAVAQTEYDPFAS